MGAYNPTVIPNRLPSGNSMLSTQGQSDLFENACDQTHPILHPSGAPSKQLFCPIELLVTSSTNALIQHKRSLSSMSWGPALSLSWHSRSVKLTITITLL